MPKKAGAGDLYDRVSFDRVGNTPDGYGGQITSYAAVFETRANFFNAGGSEAVQAARLEGRTIMRVRVRASSETRQVTTDWRMTDKRTDVHWQIREVDHVTERTQGFILMSVEEGVA